MNAERKRNIQIGLFAVVAIALLCAGLNYLKGRDLFSSGAKLTACYGSVDGLTDSSPVLFRGFKIGSVKDIEIDQFAADPSKAFTVIINIEKNVEVPIDSRAEIVSTDLLGGKGVEIILGNSDEFLSTGDTISTSVRTSFLDDLGPVKDQASELMTSATGVIKDIDTILDARNKRSIDEMLSCLNRAMRNIESLTANLSRLTCGTGAVTSTFDSSSRLMESLNAQTRNLDSIMGNVNKATGSLAAADLGHAVAGLDSVLSKVSIALSSQGNMGKLANDAQLYDNAAAAVENLNRLLVDIRLNPSRYMNISAFKFGGKQIYFSDTNTSVSVMRGTVYVVNIMTSKKPVDAPTSIAGKRVVESCYDGKYSYLVAPFASAEEAEGFMRENGLAISYSNAVVEVYVDGVRRR